MIAPTPSQLRILRLMAAGVVLQPADRTQARLVVNGVQAGIVRAKTVTTLLNNRWVVFDQSRERYTITPDGRSRAEVHTFVRAFVQETT